MRMIPPAALFTAWMLVLQTSGHASQRSIDPPPKPTPVRQAPHVVATHATRGVVKSVDATAIVITRSAAGKPVESSFQLTASTQRVGTIAAGTTVEIRYRADGKQRVATTVSVEAAAR